MRTEIQRLILKASWQIFCVLLGSFLEGLTFNSLRPEELPMIGNDRDWKTPDTENARSLDIPIAEVKTIHGEKAVLFLDARNPDQYADGHIEGALNLSWAAAEDRVFESMETIEAVSLIVTYCDGYSCSMSHHLARFLKALGFENVRVFSGGWAEWEQNDLPIST